MVERVARQLLAIAALVTLSIGCIRSGFAPSTVPDAGSANAVSGATAVAMGRYHACAIAELGDPALASVAGGSQHACAVIEGGALHCWGDNTWGQLGVDPAWSLAPSDVLVQGRP